MSWEGEKIPENVACVLCGVGGEGGSIRMYGCLYFAPLEIGPDVPESAVKLLLVLQGSSDGMLVRFTSPINHLSVNKANTLLAAGSR